MKICHKKSQICHKKSLICHKISRICHKNPNIVVSLLLAFGETFYRFFLFSTSLLTKPLRNTEASNEEWTWNDFALIFNFILFFICIYSFIHWIFGLKLRFSVIYLVDWDFYQWKNWQKYEKMCVSFRFRFAHVSNLFWVLNYDS